MGSDYFAPHEVGGAPGKTLGDLFQDLETVGALTAGALAGAFADAVEGASEDIEAAWGELGQLAVRNPNQGDTIAHTAETILARHKVQLRVTGANASVVLRYGVASAIKVAAAFLGAPFPPP